MHLPFCTVLLLSPLLAAALSPTSGPAKRSYATHDYYVLEHDPSTHPFATLSEVSRALGVELVEQAGALKNHWLVRVTKDEPRSQSWQGPRRDDALDRVLSRYNRLRAASAESIHSRSTDHILASSIRGLEKQVPRLRTKRQQPTSPPPSAADLLTAKINQVATTLQIHDPEFPTQWHIINPQHPGMDLNVTGLWEMGVTGHGVISAIVDDGLDFESEDLAENFVSEFTLAYTFAC